MGISISQIRSGGMSSKCISSPRMAFSDEATRTDLPAPIALGRIVFIQYGIVRSMQSFSDSVRGSLRCSVSRPRSSERIVVSLSDHRTSTTLST